eukprot:6316434-Prymnesium_polylepis.1
MPPPPQKRPPGVSQSESTSVHPPAACRRPSQADRLQLRSVFSSRRFCDRVPWVSRFRNAPQMCVVPGSANTRRRVPYY